MKKVTHPSVKAYYDQNRELILASKQAQNQANPKAKRVISRKKTAAGKEILRGRRLSVCMQCTIPFGCNMSNFYSRARDRYTVCIIRFLRVVCEL